MALESLGTAAESYPIAEWLGVSEGIDIDQLRLLIGPSRGNFKAQATFPGRI
jgi:hypothetical protein